MKKQIEISTKATKLIEVEVPSYYNFHGKYTAITEHAVIGVWSDGHMISFNLASNKERYSESIDNAIGLYGTQPCTKKEFETAFNKTIKCLTEQYQLSMNMILDPNTQTAEGQQATEETAALESASQDNAMEATQDSEEGSTEG
jgi:hypothetical protein